MTRKDLEEKGLNEEQISFIMAENGKDIEKVKSKFADYEELKQSLEKANATLESVKDYDEVKSSVENYKAEILKIQEDSKKQIEQMKIENNIKDFTNKKKFVNDFTRDSINSAIYSELQKAESKGKSIEDLFNSIIKDKENILVDEKKPEPPKTVPMGSQTNDKLAEENQVRAIMGLPPKNA